MHSKACAAHKPEGFRQSCFGQRLQRYHVRTDRRDSEVTAYRVGCQRHTSHETLTEPDAVAHET